MTTSFDSSRLFSILGEIHYGTPTFAAQPFAFSSGRPPEDLAPVDFAAIEFSPLSIAFESPSPGVLLYKGPPHAKVKVSYAVTIQWVTGAPTTSMLFATVVTLNDELVATTADLSFLEVGNANSVSSFEGQGLLELSPGDRLQLRISAHNVLDPGQEQQNTVDFFALSLIAHRV
jgi:hypothetical protein